MPPKPLPPPHKKQVLASKVRTKINEARNNNRFMANSDGFNYSTTRMINKYLAGKKQVRPGGGVETGCLEAGEGGAWDGGGAGGRLPGGAACGWVVLPKPCQKP
jgi:hypothetical protein